MLPVDRSLIGFHHQLKFETEKNLAMYKAKFLPIIFVVKSRDTLTLALHVKHAERRRLSLATIQLKIK